MREDRYQVWFEGEPSPRSRYFTEKKEAHAWAQANQPNRAYELWSKPASAARRLLAVLQDRRVRR